MATKLFSFVVTLWLIHTALMSPQFHMYFTNRSNDISFIQSDCLSYRVLTNIDLYYEDLIEQISVPDSIIPNHQFISYCFRPSIITSDLLFFNNTDDQNFSFFQLREQNITSEQLYAWSAPIDIIEYYQFYLMNNQSANEANMFFYNCTSPYFGSICQYHFLMNSMMTFSELVVRAIKLKDEFDGYENLTCFIHLNCTRGPAPLCLDWREICDGKLDCFDGEDEENCFDLEVNECEENEYRCQNGQCIPRRFFHDNYFNPDCLDRTDEPSRTLYYPTLCSMDPSFRCEDLQCRPSRSRIHVCGNGECEEISGDCINRRNLFFFNILFKTSNVTKQCQKAMQCIMLFNMQLDDPNECDKFCWGESCQKVIELTCPEQFLFPSYPIFYGHIRLLYLKDQLNYSKDKLLFPNYICYNITLCGSLFSKSIYSIDQLTCSIFSEIVDLNNIKANSIYSIIFELFHSCSSSRHHFSLGNETHCHHSSLFHCANTSKCISKHRLLDGIRDCQEGDDESYSFSCSLRDQNQRFSCSNDANKCFNIHQFYNDEQDCTNNEDEINQLLIDVQKHIFFQTICDGFTELTPIRINGTYLTDETNCEQWPCDNLYTRCDGIWNCKNGSDEINCTCKGQLCLSLKTEELTCLSATKVNDGKVDCIGGSDEREYCRIAERNDPDARFLCRGTTDDCISVKDLCNMEKHCPFGDDEDYCEHYNSAVTTFTDMCTIRFYYFNLTTIERFLCQLTDLPKRQMIYFSLNSIPLPAKTRSIETKRMKRDIKIDEDKVDIWLQQCNRGIPIYLRYIKDKNILKCLCPPGYYGDQCQYQNERISLTLKLQTSPPDWYRIFAILIMLIDNQEGFIQFTDQFIFNHFEDCQVKFDVNLLYSTRPKNASKTYSIRIDVFDKQTLSYRSSWIFPVQFPYLPVYRLAIELNIPLSDTKHHCSLNCSNHGQCMTYENEKQRYFCLCDEGWRGSQCSEEVQCNCASDSKCIGSFVCICKTGQFGSRCFLSDTRCQLNRCQNGGTCHSPFPDDPTSVSSCICSQGYSGDLCEKSDRKILIRFIDMSIPLDILIHFIETFQSAPHVRTTTFKKQTIGHRNMILFTSVQFHLMFIEFQSNYYLLFTNNSQNEMRLSTIETEVTTSKRCISILQLFNSTFLEQDLLIRIKSYHFICQNYRSLSCYYDNIHICLCTDNRHANCFEFNHNMTYKCQGFPYCENDAKCFQNNPSCPTSLMCVCQECYYGSRCQLSTIGFALSLDTILGYQILPQISFIHQTLPVKISTTISTLLFIFGYISGILSIITFRRKKSRTVGCGYYLFSSSVCLILIITLFQYKLWFLILSQMLIMKHYSVLLINCVIIDYLLRSFLSLSDWLNACVAIERVVSVTQGTQFNRSKSIRIAKVMILFVIILSFATHLQDPFHRELLNDEEDNRIWCITKYSSKFYIFNSAMTIIHFFTPFTINFLSGVFIIIKLAKQRLTIQKQDSYMQHIYQQIRKHKHILISPFILILLALPRLIIAFLSDCMKSQRDPWLFLIAYFVSFVPPIAHFIIFVLPSKGYKEQFSKAIIRIRHQFHLI